MKKYLIPEKGDFYKANLHCHTVISDGAKTPQEIKEIYKSLGYSVVAYTDHDVFIPHDELNDDSFLALHGFEMEINSSDRSLGYFKTCHICFIAMDPENLIQPCFSSGYLFGNAPKHLDKVVYDKSLPEYVRSYTPECINDIMKTARDKGFFVTYNHPTWSLENYPDYIEYKEMNAMEIFNGGCNCMGYDDFNPRVYEDFIRAGRKIYCLGADDNHNRRELPSRYSDSGWAFTMIKADSLAYTDITKALADGNFYASEGPEIYELTYDGGEVYIKCSDASRINITCGVRYAGSVMGENGNPVNEATFKLGDDYLWFRLTVIDKEGKRACTNVYFINELR